MRGKLMDQAYFDRKVAYDDETITEFEQLSEDESKTVVHRTKLKYNVFKKRLHALILRYSRGDAVAELKPLFPPIIPAWKRYLAAPYSDKFLILAGDTSTLENYVLALWMVSLARIFEIDEALFGRLLKCIGNEGKDILLERLIAGKTAGIAKADTLVFPKIYSPLLAAIDAEAKERPRLFKAFLDNWYRNMKPTYWYENHKGPGGGGFFGYWAIEAAGVVKTFGIDDSSFRDVPYYPTDLV